MTNCFLPRFAVTLLALSGPAAALTLEFPGDAAEIGVRVEAVTSYRMPVGPFAEGLIETRRIEGALDQRAWRFAAPGRSTLDLLLPLRAQLTGAGFTVIYECETVRCGGFDFRYATDVLPEPEMHVDLGDFRYLAASRDLAAGPEFVSLIVSRAVDQGFVQVTQVGRAAAVAPGLVALSKTPEPGGADLPVGLASGGVAASPAPGRVSGTPEAGSVEAGTPQPATAVADTLADRLIRGGAQVLPDLVFASGSAALAEGTFASLTELAGFLQTNPQARVMLVGHTDVSGDLAVNIALSRERARSVRQRLLAEFDIPARQIDAEGVGYLAPRAANDTDAGRLANRRVEVMLLSLGAG